MDPEIFYKAIKITKRDGKASRRVLREELSLNDEELTHVLQVFRQTEFVNRAYRIIDDQSEDYIERLDSEITELRRKLSDTQAYVLVAVSVSITLLFLF